MLADHVLQVERRQPFASGLDHILDAVFDGQRVVRLHGGDITGVQPASFPQLLAFVRLFEVALGQPGGPGDHFTLGFAIMGYRFAIRIDNFQFHHGHGFTGLHPDCGLLLQGQFKIRRGEVGGAQQRAGFRHAVAGEHLDAQFRPRIAQAFGQGAATDEHMPVAQVGGLDGLGGHHHLHDGGHAVGEADFVLLEQIHQQLGFIATGIDLLYSHHGGRVRHAPGVNVEHGRDRHIHRR